jgi:hypothetical protein
MTTGITLSPGEAASSLVAIVLSIAATYIGAYQHGLQAGKAQCRSKALLELNLDSERKRYQNLYVPLKKLFASHFFVATTTFRYKRLSCRIARSWRFAKRGNIRYSAKALVDQGITATAAFECGKEFPFDDIQRLVDDNLNIADSKLQDLVRTVQRMRFDSHQPLWESAGSLWDQETVLSLEEQALFSHINKEFQRLNERFALDS